MKVSKLVLLRRKVTKWVRSNEKVAKKEQQRDLSKEQQRDLPKESMKMKVHQVLGGNQQLQKNPHFFPVAFLDLLFSRIRGEIE